MKSRFAKYFLIATGKGVLSYSYAILLNSTAMENLPVKFPVFEPGSVWLVGAGPGDPGLMSLAGLHALQTTDVIVYDALEAVSQHFLFPILSVAIRGSVGS